MVAFHAQAFEHGRHGRYVIRIQFFLSDAPGYAKQVANTCFIIHNSILCGFVRRGYT